MSGLAGVWNFGGRPLERQVLLNLSATLRHRGPLGERYWIEGAVGLASRLSGNVPESSGDEQPAFLAGNVLLFDGRLDNREELIGKVRGLTIRSPDTAVVLGTYAAFGERFAEHLNGEFALALYDSTRRVLWLARDSLGVRPLYYAKLGTAFVFASEAKAILAWPGFVTHPNDRFLADILLGGLHLQPDDGATCFRDVFSLPPAHVGRLTGDQWTLRRYWDFDLSAPTERSFPAAVERFRELFQQSLRRRLRGKAPVAVAVSGGVDSSSIFCFADALAERPGVASVVGLSSQTPAGSPADEDRFVVAIENRLGVRIQRVEPSAESLASVREEIYQGEAPMMDAQRAATRALLRAARENGSRCLLSGHWGDQFLCDPTFLLEQARAGHYARAWTWLNEYAGWFTDTPRFEFRKQFLVNLVRTSVRESWWSWFRAVRSPRGRRQGPFAWYAPAFRKQRSKPGMMQDPQWHGVVPVRHGAALYRQARSKFFTLCLEWSNKVAASEGMEMSFPFLDRDLLTFLIRTPGELISRNGVPKAILRAAGRGTVPDEILDRHWKADFSDLVNEWMRHDYHKVLSALGPESASVRLGYVTARPRHDRATLGHELGKSNCDAAWVLQDLLALETWLEVFTKS